MARTVGGILLTSDARLPTPPDAAVVRVQTRRPELTARLLDGIAAELKRVGVDDTAAPLLPRVRVRHRRSAAQAAGAIAVVPVTRRAAQCLPRLLAAVEVAGALGIQLVWSGTPIEHEAVVFAALESWRGSRRACPLMLAPDARPLAWLEYEARRRARAAEPAPDAPAAQS